MTHAVELTHACAAPPERVFAAWTDAEVAATHTQGWTHSLAPIADVLGR